MAATKGKTKTGKWDPMHCVPAYKLALQGLDDKSICGELKIDPTTLRDWEHKHPAFRDAIEQGRKDRVPATESLKQHIWGLLPPHLQELWDRIDACSDSPSGYERAMSLLERQGRTARQHLFLYALSVTHLNPSEACKRVGISYSTLHAWVSEDPDFKELLDHVTEHKGNLFEAALVRKVQEGDAGAITFVNRTYNRKRGYAETVKVQKEGTETHHHTHEHRHLHLKLSDLRMAPEVAEAFVAAYLEARKGMGSGGTGEPVGADGQAAGGVCVPTPRLGDAVGGGDGRGEAGVGEGDGGLRRGDVGGYPYGLKELG